MSYSDEVVRDVWQKGRIVPENDSNAWRWDVYGAWMGWQYYGDRNSQYGWEIDHIISLAQGGADELANLRPLQWQNNVGRSAGRQGHTVAASGPDNVPV